MTPKILNSDNKRHKLFNLEQSRFDNSGFAILIWLFL
jgi:hypothetical protein